MRRPIVAGNWKMNGSRAEARALAKAIQQGVTGKQSLDIVIFPSFVFLSDIEASLKNSTTMAWGAQNICSEKSGAFTGEISAAMLVDFGCRYVLVGHSERRSLFHEDSKLVAAKFLAAKNAGIQPVLCVGETLAQREQGKTEDIIHEQLQAVMNIAGKNAFQDSIIAYEPVWAIGTGKTATPEQAQTVHAFIREAVTQQNSAVAKTIRIIYGGSVKPENAKAIFAMPDIDGGLIGGASLNAQDFLTICAAAKT